MGRYSPQYPISRIGASILFTIPVTARLMPTILPHIRPLIAPWNAKKVQIFTLDVLNARAYHVNTLRIR